MSVCRCGRRPVCWRPPPLWWLVKYGFVLPAQTRGWPVRAKIAFRPNPLDPHMPRMPWPYETESRAAGTGLAMGRLPHRC